jgi:hypothetical protein
MTPDVSTEGPTSARSAGRKARDRETFKQPPYLGRPPNRVNGISVVYFADTCQRMTQLYLKSRVACPGVFLVTSSSWSLGLSSL